MIFHYNRFVCDNLCIIPNHFFSARESAIACVQWFDMPLTDEAILKTKDQCTTNTRDYRPKPSLLYPLSKAYVLKELSTTGRLAATNQINKYRWTTGTTLVVLIIFEKR